MPRSLIAPLALACTLFGATSAQAADMTISGHANGYRTVDIALAAPNATRGFTTQAGGFASLVDGASFVTYCVDLYEFISFGATYTDYTVTPGAAHTFANTRANADIGRLYSTAGALADGIGQAAFQIAVWEIVYEASGPYELNAGAAQFSGGTAGTSGALALATTWLNALPDATHSYHLTVFESAAAGHSPGHQDQMTVTAVPEPTTFALLGIGLLGTGFVARRRMPRP